MGSNGTTQTAPAENHLLASLPEEERATLMAHMRPTHLTVKTVLFDPGQLIGHVYFPIDGVISLVTPLADGNIVDELAQPTADSVLERIRALGS